MEKSRKNRIIAPLIAAFGLALIAGDCDDCDCFDNCNGTQVSGVAAEVDVVGLSPRDQ